MPLEIRELVIKATIDDRPGNQSGEPSSADAAEYDEEQIICTCVERVLEILKDKQER